MILCPDCEFKGGLRSLSKHVKDVHGKVLCSMCLDVVFPDDLGRHLGDKHDPKRAKCPKCDFVGIGGNCDATSNGRTGSVQELSAGSRCLVQVHSAPGYRTLAFGGLLDAVLMDTVVVRPVLADFVKGI
jgi:hypothetical protein